MKLLMVILILTSVCFIAPYFVFNEGKICINNERAGIMFLRGGYRAYWVRYSEGLKYPFRTFKDNLWCWPRFEHCDVRPLMKWDSKIYQY